MTKKKKVFTIIVLGALVLCVFMLAVYRPKKGEDIVDTSGEMNITIMATSAGGNVTKSYTINEGTEVYDEIKSVFSGTKYYPTVKGWFYRKGYTLGANSGVDMVIVQIGDRNIAIDSEIGVVTYTERNNDGEIKENKYKIGNLGSSEEEILCARILTVLWANDCQEGTIIYDYKE